MYIGHDRLCVCLSVPRHIPTLLHGPGCKLGNGRGCPLVVHYWADLQLVHRFCCYDNIAPNAKCQQVLVLALCLVIWIVFIDHHTECQKTFQEPFKHKSTLELLIYW